MQTTDPHDTPLGTLADPRRTWRIPDDRRLPALEPYADDVRRLPTVTVRETLWDTTERTLAFEGIELLHAEGTGTWCIDRGDGPAVVGAGSVDDDGAPSGTVPRDAVEVFVRGRELRPVRLRDTATTLVLLHGRDGRLRAEVADVRVDEGDQDSAMLRSARWWALTDDGSPGSVVRAVERAVTDAADDDGRGPDDPVPALAPVRRPAAGTGPRPRRGSAAAFVRDALVALRADLVAVEPLVRADEPETVHAFRKVLRRLRSVLAAFRGALDRESTEALRSQLGDVARVAGVARDAQVLRDRLPGSAARAPEGYVDTATLERLGAAIDERRSDATAALRDVLRSPGWFGALDALDHVIGTSPVGDHAGDDASAFTTRRIERERTRVRSALEGDIEDLGALHEVRKAARRLRYALEAAGDLPDVGKRRLGRLARVQDTLGDALDAANAAAAYRESARVAARSGVDTFGHGALATAERGVVEERIADGRRLLGKL